MGRILEEIYSNGLTVAKAQLVRLTASLAEELFQVPTDTGVGGGGGVRLG